MGSLRNPVGPLPSSIYWRRRAVLLTVVALLALLATWVVAGSGGNGKDTADGSDGKNPVHSITPGPTGSGPAISEAPGGRDESPGGDTPGSGDGSGGSDNANDGSGSGDTGGSGSSSGSSGGSDGGSGGGAGSGASGEQVPAGSSLPDCTADEVKLTVRSVQNTYEPGEKPTFELIARNSSGSDCKVDLGPRKTVVTVTQADGDDEIWSSADCPQSAGSLTFRVRAEGSATYTVAWDRKHSAPNCATPPSGSAPAGTYLVEAKAPGLAKAQTSFVLAKD
ncbi:hypothetical protein ACFYYD_10935 [Streptomyces bluensis]|uniref:hypothetical protein n=1 Tax=Streptomyces bluensis TaxID=33897 RepID=UPI00368C6B92